MPKKKGFKSYTRSMFHVSRWMATDEIKDNFRSLKSMAKQYCTVEQAEFEETYEQAIKRLGLTESALDQKRREYLLQAYFYFAVAVALLGYAVYLYHLGHYLPMLMCLPIVLVLLSFFFKCHFWYTQIRHKRLGMSAREWFVSFVFGVNK